MLLSQQFRKYIRKTTTNFIYLVKRYNIIFVLVEEKIIMKIGIIVGSLRKEANSLKIANNLAKMFGENDQVTFIKIDDLPFYNPDLDNERQLPNSWSRLRTEVENQDGFVFVTPEYNRSIPAALKNVLDVASRPVGENKWSGKPALIISNSPGSIGGFGANHHLRQTFTFLNMPTVLQPEVYLSRVEDMIDEQGLLKSGSADFVQTAVNALIELIEKQQ